jgi:flagellar hook protein FlgE
MKKISTILFVFLLVGTLHAQVLFQQDFEEGIAPMTLVDADGRPPHANVAAYAAAWTVANPSFGNGTNLAVSNSWYNPPGVADDWMITPAIEITDPNTVLTWQAKAQDPNYPDGYQVRVSTTDTELASFTDVVFSIPNEVSSWTDRLVGLGDYVGQTIHIAFRNNSNDQFLLLVDNILVRVIQSNDAAMLRVNTVQFHELDTDIAITGTISNNGGAPLTSIDISWSDGTDTYTDNLTDLSIGPGETYDFTHSTSFSTSEPLSYDIDVWVSNPNGEDDGDETNNLVTKVISGVTFIPFKRVVAEEGTGTWCGWCPRGFYWMEYMYENYPETFIGIAVHNQDPMTVAAYDGAIGFSAYPSAHVDRVIRNSDPEDFEADYLVAINNIAPFELNATATFPEGTRDVTITASAEFVTQLQDIDYRFSVVMLQDDITGTSAGYNQANYYSSQTANIPLSGYGYDWQALPDPVPAAQMVYHHVARALLGGFNGQEGSIPDSVVAGDIVEYSFSYTVPNAFNMDNMRAAVLVIDNATGAILNGVTAPLEPATGSREVIAENMAHVFPNPFQQALYIQMNLDEAAEVSVELFNALGQQVATQHYGRQMGELNLTFTSGDLANGLYTLKVKADNRISTHRVVMQR